MGSLALCLLLMWPIEIYSGDEKMEESEVRGSISPLCSLPGG